MLRPFLRNPLTTTATVTAVLDQEELERAASVVAAQQQVQESMVDVEEAEPNPIQTVEGDETVAELNPRRPGGSRQAKDELEAGHPKAAIGLLRDRLEDGRSENIEAMDHGSHGHAPTEPGRPCAWCSTTQHSIDDQRPEGWVLVGDVHAAKGETNAAIEAYTNAIERGARRRRRAPLAIVEPE